MVQYYWSRIPGKFIDKNTGALAFSVSFNGTVREWYETLIETMYDIANQVVRLSGSDSIDGCYWVTDPNVMSMIQCSLLYRPVEEDSPAPPIGTIIVPPPPRGIICNCLISIDDALEGTGNIHLKKGDQVLGIISVMDIPT